ncbi:MAG: glutathione S-transferase family protein [Woeseiaceae bacterium]|nr:glutathione S-transferase family protein [Woeseiaceae bacterium]
MALPELTLVSHKLCPYVQRARIVLNEKSVPHKIELVDLANKPDWFLELSPLGKVPVLLVDGKAIFESAVIAEYLDEITGESMHPRDPLDRARNRSWIEFASNTLNAIAGLYSAKDRSSFEQNADLLSGRFERLERALLGSPFFNGARFSLVDAAFAPVFRYFEVIELYLELGLFRNTPKVRAWRAALHERKSVKEAVVDDYHQRLEQFFMSRDSYLAEIIRRQVAA